MIESNRQNSPVKITRLMNNGNPFITSIVTIVIIAISVMLISKCFSVNNKEYQSYQDNIIQLQQLDADFNQAILKSRYELFTSYDPLVWNLQEQRGIQQQLVNIPQSMQPEIKQQLDNILKEVATSIEQKNDLSDRFKSRNALLKNSLRYLPLLTNQLESKLDQQTKNFSPVQLSNLQTNINQLIRNLLIYNVTVDEKIQAEIESLRNNLLQLKIEYGLTPQEFPIDLVISHTNIILNTKPQVEDLTSRLTTPLTEKTQTLENLLKKNYRQVNLTSNIYRVATIAWFLLLLTLLNLILLRRSRTFNPQFTQYKRKVGRIANTLTEALAVKNDLSESNNIPDINDLVSCRDSLGELARGVIQVSQQVTRKKAGNFQSEAFAFLATKLTLVTRNNKKVFNSDMEFKIEVIFEMILDRHDCQLIKLNVSPDKLHLLFRYQPQTTLSQLIKEIKVEACDYLQREFPELANSMDGENELWSQAYLIASCDSDVLNDTQSDRLLVEKQ